MTHTPYGRVLAAIALLAAVPATADDTPIRSPGDMNVEERTAMMRAANDYQNCVYESAMAHVNDDPDIRRVADIALGECGGRLDELGDTIAGWGFEQGFATGFTRNVRDRAARRILPELAIRKSR